MDNINLIDRVIWSDRFWSKTFEYKGNIHDRLLTISWDRKISDFYRVFYWTIHFTFE